MLLETIMQSADRHPKKLAVSDAMRALTYGQLTTFSRIMRDVILKESDCEKIGFMLPGSSAATGVLLGCLWAKRTAVPLNFLLQAAELNRIVQDAGIDLIITIQHFSDQVSGLATKTVFLEQLGLKRKFVMAKLRRTPELPAAGDEDLAVLLYTSGTSAGPKGVELTYGNLMSNCRDIIDHAKIEEEHRLLSVLPPFHIFGLTATMLLPLYRGMTVHYIPRFNPAETIRTISKEDISIFMAIPSMYVAMLRTKSAQPERFKSLYLAISGGEPLQQSTAQEYEDRLGVQLNEGYGLTETSPVISINLPWDRASRSVGKPIPNCQVRIVGHEERDMPIGNEGEIRVKGPGVMKGYHRLCQQTAEAFDADGWYKTGDQGRFDSDGFLYITGRIKDIMIVGGENVFPGEIEEVLSKHPAVVESAVIGQGDPSRGEVPIAYVVCSEDAQVSENDLRSHCRQHLAGFKVPKEVHFRTDLPKGPTGKILKRELRAEMTEG